MEAADNMIILNIEREKEREWKKGKRVRENKYRDGVGRMIGGAENK